MAFSTPSYVPQLPSPPDSIPVQDFLLKDDVRYGRCETAVSKPPFTCGLSGVTYSIHEVADRVECLARSLSDRLSLKVNEGNELDKVITIFSLNTIDSLTVSWATHRLDGVSNYASSTYTVAELIYQLEKVKPAALFTCLSLLDKAFEAADAVGISRDRIFLLPMYNTNSNLTSVPEDIKDVNDLIDEGRTLAPLPPQVWAKGQGSRQVAYLCSSSGTSGLPKFVKLSHQNIIAVILQFATYEQNHKPAEPEYCLGLLPFSHVLTLMAVAQLAVYRGDGVVVLPGFELEETLGCIQDYRIGRLWMIPPILMAMLRARDIVSNYDLSRVNSAVVGATSLSEDVAAAFDSLIPGCNLIQGYGLTETTVAVTLINPADNMFCSCGSLFPGVEGRLVGSDGVEITKHNSPGELQVRSPTVFLGYLDNDAETRNMLTEDGWLRTGDLVEFRQSPKGHDHVFFLERLKELIKVRGMQVSPTEIENHLMTHPEVLNAVVVPIPDESAGELPLAFIIKAPSATKLDERLLRADIHNHVESALGKHKHLAGGIEFVTTLPKTGSGKIQRKVLKSMALNVCKSRKSSPKPLARVFTFNHDDDEFESDFTDGEEEDSSSSDESFGGNSAVFD